MTINEHEKCDAENKILTISSKVNLYNKLLNYSYFSYFVFDLQQEVNTSKSIESQLNNKTTENLVDGLEVSNILLYINF